MNCMHCDTPLPVTSRCDRRYCNNNCSALASYYRRKAGQPPPPRWQHPALVSHDPVLHSSAVRAQQLGQAHGWSKSTTRCVLDGLVTVLDGRPAGERVPLSEVRSRPHRWVSRPRLAEVLADLAMLDDDTSSATRAWIDRATSNLASGFAEPSHRWLVVLLDGDARARPRSQSTIHVYFGAVRPFLERWATTHEHLREVTATDIYSVLEPLSGWRRKNSVTALRSLFRFAKKRALIFTNPTTGVKVWASDPDLLPMTADEIRAVEQLTVSPAERVIVALAAEHAARTGTIRLLTLEDVDLPNRRITLAGHRQRLGDLSCRALREWLDHRRSAWPHTGNPHVIVSARTALGSRPVTGQFVRFQLGHNGFSVDRIRADRILDEALTTGADPLRLSRVFNISHATATRYTTVAEALLGDELELPVERGIRPSPLSCSQRTR